MKEYLKIGEAFGLPVAELTGLAMAGKATVLAQYGDDCNYALYSISSRDELAAEVDRFRGIIERAISTSHELSERGQTTQLGDGHN